MSIDRIKTAEKLLGTTFDPLDKLSHPSLPLHKFSHTILKSSPYILYPSCPLIKPLHPAIHAIHAPIQQRCIEWRSNITAMTGLLCEWAQGKSVSGMPKDFTELLMDGKDNGGRDLQGIYGARIKRACGNAIPKLAWGQGNMWDTSVRH